MFNVSIERVTKIKHLCGHVVKHISSEKIPSGRKKALRAIECSKCFYKKLISG